MGGEGGDELEVGDETGGNGGGVVEAEVRPAGPDELVQRGPPLFADVRVGPLLEQPDPDIVVRVEGRQAQGAHAVRQGVVHVGAGRDERPQHRLPVVADREQQRREAPGGARVHVSTPRDQLQDGPVVPLDSGPHQRGLAAPLLGRVDVRPVAQQRPHRTDPTGSGRPHQRGLPLGQADVRIGAGREQHLEHVGAAVGGGHQ